MGRGRDAVPDPPPSGGSQARGEEFRNCARSRGTGTKALIQSRVTHGPHCAHTQGLRRPVHTAAPAPNLWGCPVHSASSTKTKAQPGSTQHPVANSAAALARFQMVSLTMNLDVRQRRPRSKLTLIKSSQPTLHNMIISKFGQASHTARPAQQGMSQSTEGDPDRRCFQFKMSPWEG